MDGTYRRGYTAGAEATVQATSLVGVAAAQAAVLSQAQINEAFRRGYNAALEVEVSILGDEDAPDPKVSKIVTFKGLGFL